MIFNISKLFAVVCGALNIYKCFQAEIMVLVFRSKLADKAKVHQMLYLVPAFVTHNIFLYSDGTP